MKWKRCLPDAEGLWLWRLRDQKGTMGILSVRGPVATEITSCPPRHYELRDWWDTSKDIVETYYIGKEDE